MKWRLYFQLRLFSPKLCRDALIPIRQSRIALVWRPRLSFPSWEVYPALAIRLQQWVTLFLTASYFLPLPPQIPAFFSLLLVLQISHTWGSQNHPQKYSTHVDAEIGVSISWVFQGRNKTLMQMWFIYRQWETCLLTSFWNTYIHTSYFSSFPHTALNHCQCSAPAWVYEKSASGGGGSDYASGFTSAVASMFQQPFLPMFLPLPPAPECDCLADSPKRKCAKWTWQIPGWLHMARPELHVPGIPKLLSPY